MTLSPPSGDTSQTREYRKRQGIFYTPAPVARFMVWSTFRSIAATGRGLDSLRIVDPACGDGAFLWQAYQFLCENAGLTAPTARLDVIRRQIFGVDLDPRAIEQLRMRFRNDVLVNIISEERVGELCGLDQPRSRNIVLSLDGSPQCSAQRSADPIDSGNQQKNAFITQLDDVLQSNFRVGDAVSGSGWKQSDATIQRANALQFQQNIDWSAAFPAVDVAGGFDVVFANPPYRRERGAKDDLVRMNTSALGRARHAARMDLWHYFFHRSLDLLRPGGILSLIVNSAWTRAQAGRPLIARMESETTPLEFVLLERSPVFEEVDGRHLILRLKKEVASDDCRVWILNEAHFPQVREPGLWDNLLKQDVSVLKVRSEESDRSELDQFEFVPPAVETLLFPSEDAQLPAFHGFHVRRDQLFQSGRLWLHPPRLAVMSQRGLNLLDMHVPMRESLDADRARLMDWFEVRQGIAENPPKIIRKHLQVNSEWTVGQGVFLLSNDELSRLDFSEIEKRTLRPYWEAAVVDRYWLPEQPSAWLMYLTRDTAPSLDAMPRIARHLNSFRPLLERRRETLQGKLAWWHLHWPREPRLFENPKVFAVQMGRYPRFVYVPQPAYVGFSVNLIGDGSNQLAMNSKLASSGLTLESLTAILNSQFAFDWFEQHAKRRGVHLDITGGTLKQFPLPLHNRDLATQLDDFARLRSAMEIRHRLCPAAFLTREIETLEREINTLIRDWYTSGFGESTRVGSTV